MNLDSVLAKAFGSILLLGFPFTVTELHCTSANSNVEIIIHSHVQTVHLKTMSLSMDTNLTHRTLFLHTNSLN